MHAGKVCPKCGGNLMKEYNHYTHQWEWNCLQCGKIIEIKIPEKAY